MLYKIGENYVNVDEVESVLVGDSGDRSYPYSLTVNLKSGKSFTRWVSSEQKRNTVANDIAQFHRQWHTEPVNRYELDTVVSHEVQKVRNDVRTIKKLLLEVLSRE